MNGETVMEELKTKETRVRMNFSVNAKGFAQIDITSEFPTVEESSAALAEAIKEMRRILQENNIPEAGSV